MSKISRTDWIIGAAIVVVLVALLGYAITRHSGGTHTAASAPTVGSTAPTKVPASVAASAPTGTATTGAGSVTPSTPPPTTSTTTTTTAPPPISAVPGPSAIPVPGPVSTVGDSIMLDIQPDLQVDIPGIHVDGLVSRQFETGIGIVQADRAAGTLGNVLVVELGTNGTVTSSDFDAMMQAASGVKRVIFVNVNVPRPWMAPDNAVLAAGVARYPGVAVLADWNTLSAGHPEWFTPDEVHLEPAGAAAMAALITRYA
jgi:hypothetical protein